MVFRLSQLHLGASARHGCELKREHNRGFFLRTASVARIETEYHKLPRLYAFAQSYSFSSCSPVFPPYDVNIHLDSIQFAIKYNLSVTHMSDRVESSLVVSKLFLPCRDKSIDIKY